MTLPAVPNATLHTERWAFDFRGESFEIDYHYYVDASTGGRFTITEIDEINLNQVYGQYRDKHGIPGVEEIKGIRDQSGMSAAHLSEILGLDPDTWDRYERGTVPTPAIGQLISSFKAPHQLKKFLEQGRPPLLT